MNKQPPRIGTRASIARVETVTRSLWGCGGTITAVNVARDFNGDPIHIIELDEPAANHHTQNKSWRLRADQLDY